ncbi:hypothetical protein [Pseudonocardia sp. WMMC193]|uniref:hypothetical protein n=1 Tax=Pseudonocardia sp. WMMC193 TaxID=2911965 RepID=UPI001F48A354|nr:hypothetical protein [Pseudonocardia sp. WMMC193]MCF7553343.1 hypothetical protein [Pseudonocardia sp. WMMC193]
MPEVEGLGRLVQRRAEPVPAPRRRLVAVAVSPMELLRPESDLARIIGESGRVDLLIARDDAPSPAEVPGPLVSPEAVWVDPDDLDEDEDYPGFDEDDEDDGVAAAVAALDLPDLRVHRLGLPGRLGADAADVLVAALSELVGFDPEPGVYCVSPAPAPGDPERSAVVAAAQRIGRAYGVPMLRYKSLELSVVD